MPVVKCTEQKTPLSHFSAHAPHVHTAWPIAEANRLYLRSSTWQIFCQARQVLVSKLHSVFMHHAVISSVRAWEPRLCLGSNTCFPVSKRQNKNKHVWIVSPYHPAVRGLQATIETVQQRWSRAHFKIPIRMSNSTEGMLSLADFLIKPMHSGKNWWM